MMAGFEHQLFLKKFKDIISRKVLNTQTHKIFYIVLNTSKYLYDAYPIMLQSTIKDWWGFAYIYFTVDDEWANRLTEKKFSKLKKAIEVRQFLHFS